MFLSTDSKGAEIREFVSLVGGNTVDLQSSGVDRRRLANFAFPALPNFNNPLSDYFVLPTRNELGGSEITVQKRQFQSRAKEVIGSQRVGAWYNPESPGQGFLLEQIGNVQFLAWFHGSDIDTYTQDSLAPKHLTCLTMQGDATPSDKRVALKIYDTRQGAFATGPANPPMEIGSAQLTFQSCMEATLSYEYAREIPEPSLFLSMRNNTDFVRGVIPLRSLLPATGCASTSSLPAPISNKTGLFHDANVAGQGIMTVFNQGTLFAGWFSFDPQAAADDSAKQLWFTLQASDIVGNPNRMSARIYRTLGARRDQHSSTSTLDIGDAVLDFTACDKIDRAPPIY